MIRRHPSAALLLLVLAGATFVPGVPAHSGQATACAGGTIVVKGMMVSAKAEFSREGGPGFVYRTRLADRKLALDCRK